MSRSTDKGVGNRIGQLSGHSKSVIMNCPWEVKRTVESSIFAELQKRDERMSVNHFNSGRLLSVGTRRRNEQNGTVEKLTSVNNRTSISTHPRRPARPSPDEVNVDGSDLLIKIPNP